MTPKRTKTVRAVAQLMVTDSGVPWLSCVEPYHQFGRGDNKRDARETSIMRQAYRDEGNVIDCTITFQLPNRRTNTKGKK